MTTADGTLAELATPYIALDEEQVARFADYRRLLIEWNGRFNLTAVTDPDEIDRRLFLDALRMVRPIREFAGPAPVRGRPDGPSQPIRLVDIGTGAGFPGLALKIGMPDLDITLIEATGKKVQFLQAVIAELGLVDVVAIHGRAEELAHQPAYRGAFDACTARGVSSLAALFEMSAPLLRRDGMGLFPKGLDIADELASGKRAAGMVGVEVLSSEVIPGSETRLVVARKAAETPDQYPRRPGMPSREPLGSGRSATRSRRNG
ncbi:MAG TPA: 16S rRNA (guanine(527)-N(7))-methyltransferase RsmG [Thermomicrobiales bacterium]|jgi:16S rRNA (guanine527-N7)-methyltransferase|nr:16S rRNA (guanine(527)-N(7))-methyltransferase RsmG [Thermomicrobiales bacterium]